jgi:hypothetical protein
MTPQSTLHTSFGLLAAVILSACSGGPQPADSGLEAEAARLEQRITQLQDLNAIKRLQRAYGYYVDEAQWDRVADLFTEDGSVEYGLDGVYTGRERIREYLRAMGDGRSGLSPGQLNEHLQLMPVVNLGADGRTARGTWRAVILAGKLGENALWGEGPYENEYVKEDGVWKLRRLHWFQTLLVPYEGGWAKQADVNGARFVTTLRPDAPSTVSYQSWPGAFVPPFHFRQGTRSLVSPFPDAPAQGAATTREPLATRISILAQRAALLRDQYQIENLQRIYGFYIDKGQWDEAADLFSSDATLEIVGRGTWAGQARIREYLHAIGPSGPAPGRLYDNMQLQPIVTVAPDRSTAEGRWHLFAQYALAGQFHEWGTGVYENAYVREDGRWKLRSLKLYPTMFTPYEQGWGREALPHSRMEPALAPDRASRGPLPGYEQVHVVPPHYPDPGDARAQARRDAAIARAARAVPDAAAALRAAEREVRELEDVAQIENLQAIYGYYLATLEWDALTELFTQDGTIEIALRGIYVGKPAVRRNLDLYGKQGLDQGVLHNHMQYQFVVHVAPDGRTANLRSRALSMMGNFGRSGMWMGGIYENDFVKEDGVWRFRTDRQMNTYFAPYETGWKDLALRPAPGITASNPPDRPPSAQFELYPRNYLPPYHYPNPVTGKAFAGAPSQ